MHLRHSPSVALIAPALTAPALTALALALALLPTAAVAQSWTEILPTTVPGQRRAGAMAFDASANRLIMYGGVTATPALILNQTWAYNGQWTLLAPATPGLARWGHRMVRRSGNRLVTFGGRSPTISGFANDTFEWTGTNWTQVLTPTAPSPRHVYGMAFDSTRDVVVLFGGRSATTTLSDTWEYDGVTWTERSPTNSPSAREDALMVFDVGLNRTVLFGGRERDLDLVFGDTWIYNGTTWTNATPPVSPSPRYRMGGAYDSVRQRTVMFGGFDGTTLREDTYEFTGSDWNPVTTPSVPDNSTEAFAGYDPMRRKFVLFGGFGGTFSTSTWEFTGSTQGVFSTFGTGCQVLGSTPPVLTGSTPTLGQPLQLGLSVSSPVALFAIWALGLSNTTWQSLPLPLDLGIIGLPGCNLYVAADSIDFSVIAASTATYTFNIPNVPTLLNSTLFVQGLTTTSALTFLGVSPGGRAVIGN